MRFLTTAFVEGIKMAAEVAGYKVEEHDRGTDAERLLVRFPDGGVMVMQNDLPIAPGEKFVFVTTYTPGPEAPVSISIRQHRAKRKPKKITN